MTAQNIIDEAKLDFPDETDTRALSDLQSIHDHLLFKFKIYWSTENVSLTADTQEYTIPTDTNRVYQVRYYTSATEYKVLTATHIDKLDKENSKWRMHDSGTPREFYADLGRGKIGFYPAPDTTTSGYPIVQADVSKRQTLSVGDTLPGSLPSYQAWVEGVRYRMALRVNDERVGAYLSMFKHEVALLDLSLRGAADFTPTVRMENQIRQNIRRV